MLQGVPRTFEVGIAWGMLFNVWGHGWGLDHPIVGTQQMPISAP